MTRYADCECRWHYPVGVVCGVPPGLCATISKGSPPPLSDRIRSHAGSDEHAPVADAGGLQLHVRLSIAAGGQNMPHPFQRSVAGCDAEQLNARM